LCLLQILFFKIAPGRGSELEPEADKDDTASKFNTPLLDMCDSASGRMDVLQLLPALPTARANLVEAASANAFESCKAHMAVQGRPLEVRACCVCALTLMMRTS
jgi:hypothetical protein